jgi:hypothetical protein
MSPEQKLEYLKRYMAYWIEHRHWEKWEMNLHFRGLEAFGMVIIPKGEPLKTFEQWLADTRRAEVVYFRIFDKPYFASVGLLDTWYNKTKGYLL